MLASRVPTLVAIGHEVDVSLSELAADKRASTPSNAAEILAPDRKGELENLNLVKNNFRQYLQATIKSEAATIALASQQLLHDLQMALEKISQNIEAVKALVEAYNPKLVLKRGYAIARIGGSVIKSAKQVKLGDDLSLVLGDGQLRTTVKAINGERN